MERIQSINPGRIAWCCAERGISLAQLALEAGIAETTINKAMSGDIDLTFNQLRKIADYFGRGAFFFLEAEAVDEERVHTPQFRTLAKQKPRLSPKIKVLIQRVERQRAIYLSLREDLGEREPPRFNPPAVDRQNPREAAGIARDWLGLREENSFESYRSAVEARGVLVFRSNGYAGRWQIAKDNPILGFSLYDNSCPVMFVKKQNAETRQTFTLMHELGHVLLHETSAIDDERDLLSSEGRERDANAFAGYLLVPDAFLPTIRDPHPNEVSEYDAWLERYRKLWGVSGEVILRRLLDLGRLPQAKYEEYRQWRDKQPDTSSTSGSRKYRHREPKHVFGDKYVRTVFDALNTREITLAKASSYLDGLKIDDLHRLEKHYAGF